MIDYRITPLVHNVSFHPICAAEVIGSGARCKLKAHHLFQGVRLCRKHAGEKVLAYLIQHGVGLERAYQRGYADARSHTPSVYADESTETRS